MLSLLLTFSATTALAQDDGSIVDNLLAIDGMQALVAAVLVVDEAQVLEFSIAEALSTIDDIVILAPVNSAFEELLGLDSGFLDGLSVDEVKAALPGVLESLGLGVTDVINILLLHVGQIPDLDEDNAGAEALLESGGVVVAGLTEPLPVSLGSKGVRINYEASAVAPDVFVDNGVIHFIDTVIVDDLLAQ